MDRGIKWVNEVSWDNKTRIAAILLAQTTKQAEYVRNAQTLCQWAHSDNSSKTTEGLLFINKRGANRYAANITFACLAYSKYFPSKTFDSFSRKQIHLLLGDAGRSFVVGFGNNPRPVHIIVVPHAPITLNHVAENSFKHLLEILRSYMEHWLVVQKTKMATMLTVGKIIFVTKFR